MTTFNAWLADFVSEKGIDVDHIFEVPGESGPNFIPVSAVIAQLEILPQITQAMAKDKLVRIDFANGDVMHFFKYIAAKMAI